jgi:hypothetical protein
LPAVGIGRKTEKRGQFRGFKKPKINDICGICSVVDERRVRDKSHIYVHTKSDKNSGALYSYDLIRTVVRSRHTKRPQLSCWHRAAGYGAGVGDDHMRRFVTAGKMLLFMFLLLSVPSQAQLQGEGSGLVGWWKFDEGSGTVALDSSGKGHDGTLRNGPAWVAGKIGSGALSFDGVSTFVDIPASTDFDFAGQYTISAWVYSTNPDPRVSAVARAMDNLWHLWTLEQVLSGRFDIEYVARSVYGISSYRGQGYGLGYSANAWHHVVGVKLPSPDNFVRVYIDGQQGVDSRALTDPDPDLSGVHVTIGSRRSIAPDAVWFGYIDDVRIYNRALSASEVSDLFNQRDTQLPNPPQNLRIIQ